MIQPNFFIFGCERSGTTVLCALLSQHSDVFCLNDGFIFDIYAKSQGLKSPSNYWKYALLSKFKPLPSEGYTVTSVEVKAYFDKLIKRYNKPDPGKSKPGFLKEYADRFDVENILSKASTNSLTLRELFGLTYAKLVPENQRRKLVFGEKTPCHCYYYSWILDLYPEAKSLTLIRNPITNIAAIYKRFKDLETSINLYLSYHTRRFNPLYEGKKGLVIRYEELLQDSEAVLSHIYSTIGVDPSSIATEFNYSIKQDYVGTTIDPKRDLELQHLFNDQQKELVLKRCRHVFKRYYPEQL